MLYVKLAYLVSKNKDAEIANGIISEELAIKRNSKNRQRANYNCVPQVHLHLMKTG
jgi:hypothetical protein